jgi:pimeloyl-ACP methyl ester carboxylesterase
LTGSGRSPGVSISATLQIMRFLLILCCLVTTLRAAEPKTSTWQGYERVDFTHGTRAAILVKPKTPAAGRPWIWRTEFFGHEPQADVALLGLGWHVAYVKVSDMYGAPPAIKIMADFHAHVTHEFGLNPKAVLEGFSRGGLYAVNFAAEHPSKTAALYLDAPVIDLRSWPGGKGKGKGSAQLWQQALGVYGLTEDTAKDFPGNALNKAETLGKLKIPILSVCGTVDDVVPMDENTTPFAERVRAAGGIIEVIPKPGVNHHPHSLKDPKPIVDFLLRHAYVPAAGNP